MILLNKDLKVSKQQTIGEYRFGFFNSTNFFPQEISLYGNVGQWYSIWPLL